MTLDDIIVDLKVNASLARIVNNIYPELYDKLGVYVDLLSDMNDDTVDLLLEYIDLQYDYIKDDLMLYRKSVINLQDMKAIIHIVD